MELFTHNHAGWCSHGYNLDTNDAKSKEKAINDTLLKTHSFLHEFSGKYRFEIIDTPKASFSGLVHVFWESNEDCPGKTIFMPINKGDVWFKAFDFNFAKSTSCQYCGGTGICHYSGPFFHCWSCDGTTESIRATTPRGFMKKPTEHASSTSKVEYAKWASENSHLLQPIATKP